MQSGRRWGKSLESIAWPYLVAETPQKIVSDFDSLPASRASATANPGRGRYVARGVGFFRQTPHVYGRWRAWAALTLLLMNNRARWVGKRFRNGIAANAVLVATLGLFAYLAISKGLDHLLGVTG